MVFLVNKTCTKMTFLPLGTTLPPKSIITAQIHVEFILTQIILTKVLQQPNLRPTGFWIIKI